MVVSSLILSHIPSNLEQPTGTDQKQAPRKARFPYTNTQGKVRLTQHKLFQPNANGKTSHMWYE